MGSDRDKDIGASIPLKELRLSARISSPLDAARLFGVHLTTWKRWEDHEAAPVAVRLALRLLGGYLPHQEWHGWRFSPVDGLLWSPEGFGYESSELRGLHYLRAAVRDLLAENAALKNQQPEGPTTVEPAYLNNIIPFQINKRVQRTR